MAWYEYEPATRPLYAPLEVSTTKGGWLALALVLSAVGWIGCMMVVLLGLIRILVA